MSTDDLVSKEELSRNVQEYINHRIENRFHDPSHSVCVFQIFSCNPFRISDNTHHVDVSDPSVIQAKLKAVNKNANWVTMRGALISLKKWRFASSYDEVHDKLKLDIIVDEVDYLQGDEVAHQAVSDKIVPLLEGPELKNKFNRLRKFHIAEEFNTHYPIETALDLIDQERQNASEVSRLKDVSHVRPGEGEESQKNNSFWPEAAEKSNQGEIQESQPINSLDEQKDINQDRFHESIPAHNQFQSQLENQDLFIGNEKFDSQLNPFQAIQQEMQSEDELKDYIDNLEDRDNEEPKERMEIEAAQDQEQVDREKNTSKGKLHDVLTHKRDSLNSASKPGSKKAPQGMIMDNYAEQQNFMKKRQDKKAAPIQSSQDSDIFSLLNPVEKPKPVAEPPKQANKEPLPKIQVHKPPMSTETHNLAPSSTYNQTLQREERPKKAPITFKSDVYVPPSTHNVQREDKTKKIPASSKMEVQAPQSVQNLPKDDRSKKRKEPDTRDMRDIREKAATTIEKKPQQVGGKVEMKSYENSNNDYLRTFKHIKTIPLKKEEKDTKLAEFIKKDIELDAKKKLQKQPSIIFEEPDKKVVPQLKKSKPTVLYAENPINKKLLFDLSEFKTVQWNTATSSRTPHVGSKGAKHRVFDEDDDFIH